MPCAKLVRVARAGTTLSNAADASFSRKMPGLREVRLIS